MCIECWVYKIKNEFSNNFTLQYQYYNYRNRPIGKHYTHAHIYKYIYCTLRLKILIIINYFQILIYNIIIVKSISIVLKLFRSIQICTDCRRLRMTTGAEISTIALDIIINAFRLKLIALNAKIIILTEI